VPLVISTPPFALKVPVPPSVPPLNVKRPLTVTVSEPARVPPVMLSVVGVSVLPLLKLAVPEVKTRFAPMFVRVAAALKLTVAPATVVVPVTL
jgi:hypothetical protein